jgi:hypothetical protein
MNINIYVYIYIYIYITYIQGVILTMGIKTCICIYIYIYTYIYISTVIFIYIHMRIYIGGNTDYGDQNMYMLEYFASEYNKSQQVLPFSIDQYVKTYWLEQYKGNICIYI